MFTAEQFMEGPTRLIATLTEIWRQFHGRREFDALIDADVIAFLDQNDNDGAYQLARTLERKAGQRNDRTTARHFRIVALRITEVTGRTIGKIDTRHGDQRYRKPSRVIENGRTRRIR